MSNENIDEAVSRIVSEIEQMENVSEVEKSHGKHHYKLTVSKPLSVWRLEQLVDDDIKVSVILNTNHVGLFFT